MGKDMILIGIGFLGLFLLLIDFGWSVWKQHKKAVARLYNTIYRSDGRVERRPNIIYILDPNHPINKR